MGEVRIGEGSKRGGRAGGCGAPVPALRVEGRLCGRQDWGAKGEASRCPALLVLLWKMDLSFKAVVTPVRPADGGWIIADQNAGGKDYFNNPAKRQELGERKAANTCERCREGQACSTGSWGGCTSAEKKRNQDKEMASLCTLRKRFYRRCKCNLEYGKVAGSLRGERLGSR